MSRTSPLDDVERIYRCGRAALWLPRALAGSVLAAGLLTAYSLAAASHASVVGQFRTALVVFAAIVALWLVRKGAEVRVVVRVGRDGLAFHLGARRLDLRFRDIAALRYEAPFAVARSCWLPALALIDRRGVSWRVPAVLVGGEKLVERILARSGREDLAAWADALDLSARMARAGMRVAVGYVFAAVLLGAAGIFYLR